MKQNYQQKGFSLMEVVVVMFIVAIGLIGIVSLIVQNIQAKDLNQDTLVASQLAQEGLELVRNVRDTNWLESEWFGSGLVLEGGTSIITIYFDGNSININDSVSDIDEDGAILKKNNGFYVHGEGEGTIYRRVIEIDNTDFASYTIVSSLVQWQNRGKTNQYRTDTVLYDWR